MAIQKPEWFRMDAAKFLSDAQVDAMSTLELGACFRLLCRQWIDGHIPDDERLLARLCRLDADAMRDAWVTLSHFFPVVEPGKRANRYMFIERDKVTAALERKSDEGTRAARKRWDEAKQKTDATPNGSPIPDPMQDQTRADQSRADKTRKEKTLSSEGDASDDVPALNRQLLAKLKQIVWPYYVEAVERNQKTYEFTSIRQKKGLARLRECLRKTGGNLERAVDLMKLAVDGLAASDWHMGRDPKTNGKRYCDWETHLLGSYERMEKWWNAIDEGAPSDQDATTAGANGTGCLVFKAGAAHAD